MTTDEFSTGFDVLLNSYSQGVSLAINDYEKSIYLTEAQSITVKDYYSGKLGGDNFESTEESRRAMDALVTTVNPSRISSINAVDKRSVFFKLPEDTWYVTYESAVLTEGYYCESKRDIKVIPMKQDEWNRVKDNPFRGPTKRKAVRLDAGKNTVEIISDYPVESYTVRYIRKPKPIILTDLDEGLSIEGISTITECELNSALHDIILQRAVRLALTRIAGK